MVIATDDEGKDKRRGYEDIRRTGKGRTMVKEQEFHRYLRQKKMRNKIPNTKIGYSRKLAARRCSSIFKLGIVSSSKFFK